MGGACGYGNVVDGGYSKYTAALSYALFNDGLTCGACYTLMCYDDPKWCKQGSSITVSATNSCPPSNKPSDNGGWCNRPRQHFDLSWQAFSQIVIADTPGIVPVLYERVACQKNGNIKIKITTQPYLNLVLVTNVGGAGDVHAVSVKGSPTGSWQQLTRSWGQNWAISTSGFSSAQSLSFQVTTSDGKSVTCNVASGWNFGKTYDGGAQFKS
ncbi:expansin-a8 [Phtheirospermum japonicum]|uniref:Expansin n=1 Tax=Phtheirospermum japonicum TaxID=374723 RepID=A0A830BIA9_9LAMI|nr:expansin-a8 [Phtheirospermum japonicum]